MTAQVIFLCQWINCPDETQRENWDRQNKIRLARAKLFYDIRVLGVDEYQSELCYNRWIHANRDCLKLVNNDQIHDDSK